MQETENTYSFFGIKITITKRQKSERFLLLCRDKDDKDFTPVCAWGTSIEDVKQKWEYNADLPIIHVIPYRYIPCK